MNGCDRFKNDRCFPRRRHNRLQPKMMHPAYSRVKSLRAERAAKLPVKADTSANFNRLFTANGKKSLCGLRTEPVFTSR